MPKRASNGRFVKGGGGKRGSSRRSMKSNRRKAARKDNVNAEDVVGGSLALVGLLGGSDFPIDPTGGTAQSPLALNGAPVSDRLYNLKANLPFVGTDPNHATNRDLVDAGVAVKAVGWAARKLGHRSKHHLKVGRHRIGF
jgi:hypothetical protein